MPGYDNWKTRDPRDVDAADVKTEVIMHLPQDLDKDLIVEKMEQKHFDCEKMNLTENGWSITFTQEIEYAGNSDDFEQYIRTEIIGSELFDQMDEVEIDTSGLDYGPDVDDHDHQHDL